MRKSTFERRRLLKLAGALSLGVPPLARRLLAATLPSAGANLLLLYMPNCSQQRDWLPNGGLDVAAKSGQAGAFTLGGGAMPFEAVRQHMTLVTGVNVPGAEGGDLHSGSVIQIMTGFSAKAYYATAPSFDQLLLAKSKLLAGGRIPSLNFCCDTRSDRNDLHHRITSYDLTATPISPENRPYQAYVRLFGDSVPGQTATDRAATLAQTRARGASVLDYVTGSLSRLSARTPAEQRHQLDVHLDGIRELERSLDAAQSAPPPSVDAGGWDALRANDSRDHQKTIDAFWKLTKAALQLESTHVVSYMFATGNSYVTMADVVPGLNRQGVHSLTHGDHDAYRMTLLQTTAFYTQQAAGFVRDLAATPDPAGGSLLDRTLTLFFSEVSIIGQGESGSHNHKDIPLALFGGSSLGHVGGRCVRYGGQNVHGVIRAIGGCFGVPFDDFGDRKFAGPSLSEVIA